MFFFNNRGINRNELQRTYEIENNESPYNVGETKNDILI